MFRKNIHKGIRALPPSLVVKKDHQAFMKQIPRRFRLRYDGDYSHHSACYCLHSLFVPSQIYLSVPIYCVPIMYIVQYPFTDHYHEVEELYFRRQTSLRLMLVVAKNTGLSHPYCTHYSNSTYHRLGFGSSLNIWKLPSVPFM